MVVPSQLDSNAAPGLFQPCQAHPATALSPLLGQAITETNLPPKLQFYFSPQSSLPWQLLCLPGLWFPLTPSGSLPAFHGRGSSLPLKANTGELNFYCCSKRYWARYGGHQQAGLSLLWLPCLLWPPMPQALGRSCWLISPRIFIKCCWASPTAFPLRAVTCQKWWSEETLE